MHLEALKLEFLAIVCSLQLQTLNIQASYTMHTDHAMLSRFCELCCTNPQVICMSMQCANPSAGILSSFLRCAHTGLGWGLCTCGKGHSQKRGKTSARTCLEVSRPPRPWFSARLAHGHPQQEQRLPSTECHDRRVQDIDLVGGLEQDGKLPRTYAEASSPSMCKS